MEERPKAILERLFDGNTAKVLDHLEMTRPFDFSLRELSEINNLNEHTLVEILHCLADEFDLVETKLVDAVVRFKYADNEKTKALSRFLYQVVVWNLDQLTNSTGGSSND